MTAREVWRAARTALLLILLACVIAVLGALAVPYVAHAQETPAPAPSAPAEDCPAASLGIPCLQDRATDAVVGGVGGAIQGAAEDAFCPKTPPIVRAPHTDVPWADPGGQTQFQKYGYGGLQITTHEQGCFAQIKAGTASGVNDAILAVDELVNAAQVSAVGGGVTSSFDQVLPGALTALKDTFWGEWMPVAATVVGLLILALGLTGRSSAMIAVGVNLVVVLGFVPWLLTNSDAVTGLSERLTVGVAEQTAQGLMDLHPSAAGDSPAAAYGDAYYQLAWRSHIAQSFESHEQCATEYAPQFVPTKTFSYDELRALNAGDTALEARLVEEKGQQWNALAEQMKAEYPACYATWANPEGAWGPVIKHGLVAVFAGVWILLLSLAIVALQFLLPFGLLLLAGLGVVALVQGRLTAAYTGLLITGIGGPPLMALVSGAMLFFFYVVVADPATAWWHAIVLGVGLGFGALIALKWLGPAIIGAGALGMASKTSRKGIARGRKNIAAGGAARAAGAAAAGGAAGAAVGSRGPGPGPDGPGSHTPGDQVGFGRPVPGQVDAAAPEQPEQHADPDGPRIEPWWNSSGRRVDVDSSGAGPAGPGWQQSPEGMAQDWSTFGDTGPVDSGVVTVGTAGSAPDPTIPTEPPMPQHSDTPGDYVPGQTHPAMPEPSTGDRDLVRSTLAAYGGRGAPAIGDSAEPPRSVFAPSGGVDG